jgi:hypothetical protein
MLYLYIIVILLTTYSFYTLKIKKPLFTIIDNEYQYPKNASFLNQNCKIDKTCWIYPDHENNIIKNTYPKMSRNYIFIYNQHKNIKLPNQYFKNNYGNILL